MYQLGLEVDGNAAVANGAWREREKTLSWMVQQYGGVDVWRFGRGKPVIATFASAHEAELFVEEAELKGYSVALRGGSQ